MFAYWCIAHFPFPSCHHVCPPDPLAFSKLKHMLCANFLPASDGRKIAVSFKLPLRCLRIGTNNNTGTDSDSDTDTEPQVCTDTDTDADTEMATATKSFEVHRSKWPRRRQAKSVVIAGFRLLVLAIGPSGRGLLGDRLFWPQTTRHTLWGFVFKS